MVKEAADGVVHVAKEKDDDEILVVEDTMNDVDQGLGPQEGVLTSGVKLVTRIIFIICSLLLLFKS